MIGENKIMQVKREREFFGLQLTCINKKSDLLSIFFSFCFIV